MIACIHPSELDGHVPEEDIEELDKAYDVVENVHEDDIIDDMSIKTNINDDDDMTINPFNELNLDWMIQMWTWIKKMINYIE